MINKRILNYYNGFLTKIISSRYFKRKFQQLVVDYPKEIKNLETNIYNKDIEIEKLNQKLSQFQKDKSEFTIEENKFTKAFSQAGEDMIVSFILRHFMQVSDESIKYIDVGMNDPIFCNNTYYFYRKGGKGILVEPNPISCKDAISVREKDLVLNKAIECGEENLTYYMLEEKFSGLNTFSQAKAEQLIKKGFKIIKKLKIEMISLNKVFDLFIEKFGDIIHLVTIDVEGLETEILKNVDFVKYRPWIYCVESDQDEYSYGSPQKLISFFEKNSYIYVANTSINMIFVAKEHFTLKNFVWYENSN